MLKLTFPTSFKVLLLPRLRRNYSCDHHKRFKDWKSLLIFPFALSGAKNSVVSFGKRFKLRGGSYQEASHALRCLSILTLVHRKLYFNSVLQNEWSSFKTVTITFNLHVYNNFVRAKIRNIVRHMFHSDLVLKIYWTTGDFILKKYPK